jgi:hypothetical protein
MFFTSCAEPLGITRSITSSLQDKHPLRYNQQHYLLGRLPNVSKGGMSALEVTRPTTLAGTYYQISEHRSSGHHGVVAHTFPREASAMALVTMECSIRLLFSASFPPDNTTHQQQQHATCHCLYATYDYMTQADL